MYIVPERCGGYLSCTGYRECGSWAELRLSVLTAQEEAYRPDPLAQAIANLIKADPSKYLDMFNFRSEICISCDWRRMELSPKVIISLQQLQIYLMYEPMCPLEGLHLITCMTWHK